MYALNGVMFHSLMKSQCRIGIQCPLNYNKKLFILKNIENSNIFVPRTSYIRMNLRHFPPIQFNKEISIWKSFFLFRFVFLLLFALILLFILLLSFIISAIASSQSNNAQKLNTIINFMKFDSKHKPYNLIIVFNLTKLR